MENVTITLSFASLEEAAAFLNEKVGPATKIESVKVAKDPVKKAGAKAKDAIAAGEAFTEGLQAGIKAEDAPTVAAAKTGAEKSFAKAATKAEVRAAALELSKAGKTAEIEAIFKKYGAKSLSGLNADDYAAVLADLKEVANG